MQQVGPKGEGQGEGKWGVGRGLHPCPGSFALCASSPPCVWVISNLLGEPVCISTHLHACTQAQPRLSSNLVFVINKCFHFSKPQSHILQWAEFPELSGKLRAGDGLGWTNEAGTEVGGTMGPGGSPVTPIPGTMCHTGAQDHCGDLQATTKGTTVLCVPRASWRGLGGDRRHQEETPRGRLLRIPET